MATFTCKSNETVLLPTFRTAIEVVKIEPGVVHLGIDAPPEVPIRCESGATQGETDEGNSPRFLRQLSDRLKTTALGLGLLRLQLDAGLTEEASACLAQIQDDFQMLRFAVEGERETPPSRPAFRKSKRRKERLVEDDRTEKELLAGFLRQSGLKVDAGGDGADASLASLLLIGPPTRGGASRDSGASESPSASARAYSNRCPA